MVCPGNHEIEQIHVDKKMNKKIEKNSKILKNYKNNEIFMNNVIDYGDNNINKDNEMYNDNEMSEIEVYTAFEYRYKMPAIKAAEYGKTIIAGNYDICIFMSRYVYIMLICVNVCIIYLFDDKITLY
jgi:hypothetical protein